MLAPAVGGLLVQFISWRMVFVLIAVMSLLVAALVTTAMPETLDDADRTPIAIRSTGGAIAVTLRNRVFLCFILIFGLMAAAQLSFGVVGPFLYQDLLGFQPAAYGLVALAVGAANLLGELSCGYFAVRTSVRRLAYSALAVFGLGAAALVVREPLPFWKLAAAALVVCGLAVNQFWKPRETVPA